MSLYEFKQLLSSNDTESNSIILGSIATYEHICVLVKKTEQKKKKKVAERTMGKPAEEKLRTTKPDQT